MINDLFEMIVKPIAIFLGKHSPFILGVIINIALIMAISKIIDAFEIKIESKLKDRNTDSPLLNLMPVLVKVIKAVIIL